MAIGDSLGEARRVGGSEPSPTHRGDALIFITAKFPIKPEHADDWPRLSRAFTEANRAEDGYLWFVWSRSLEDPN